MKVIFFHQHGGPEVSEYAAFPTPVPKPGEALIRLQAAALNRVDVMVRNGWPGLKLEMPHINGADGAGEIIAFGDDTSELMASPGSTQEPGDLRLETGDRVVINANLGCGRCEFCLAGKDNLCHEWYLLGETVRGTYAEYVSLPIKQIYRLPQDFDYHQAAAAALVYQTGEFAEWGDGARCRRGRRGKHCQRADRQIYRGTGGCREFGCEKIGTG